MTTAKIRVMLIDDEKPALEEMEYLLGSYPYVEIVSMLQDECSTLAAISKIKPDVVFLDINMPGINGLELALQIQELNAGILIVFVTAYSEYALEAYKTYPLDFLLKPVEEDRLMKTLEHISSQKYLLHTKYGPKSFKIQCLGKFELADSEDSDAVRLNNKKERLLLAYLVSHFHKEVSREELIKLLFDCAENSKIINHLHVMIYNLRKTLNSAGVSCTIEYSGGNYILKTAPGFCDYVDFVRFIRENSTIKAENAAQAEHYLSSCGNSFLEGEDYPWMAETQGWLNRQYEKLALQIAVYFEQAEDYGSAARCLKRMVEKDSFCEELWRALLDLYIATGNRIAFVKYYEKYAKLLKNELHTEPEPKFSESAKIFLRELRQTQV